MIYCCGVYHRPVQTVFLMPNFKYKERKLEIFICSNCGKIAARLTQFNIQTNKYEEYKPSSRKKTEEFIQKIKNGKFEKNSQKIGSKNSSSFVYGLNKCYKNGEIRQYAVSFNQEKKLVKIIKEIK
ncbi:hypothetical protein IJD44_02460 [bacterium]|nr:hypothetical protein [bacterium]